MPRGTLDRAIEKTENMASKTVKIDHQGTKKAHRPGISPRGAETVDVILKAARRVLVEEGAPAFTLRRIAAECGMQMGNVNRHFPRKEMLIRVLLEDLFEHGHEDIAPEYRMDNRPAEEQLAIFIRSSLDRVATKDLTRLFIELWAMANHSEYVADKVEIAYRNLNNLMSPMITEINPALSPEDVEVVALYINTSIEGTTMIAGYGKPWSSKMPQLKEIAVKSLVDLAKTITPEQVRGIAGPTEQALTSPRRATRSASPLKKKSDSELLT